MNFNDMYIDFITKSQKYLKEYDKENLKKLINEYHQFSRNIIPKYYSKEFLEPLGKMFVENYIEVLKFINKKDFNEKAKEEVSFKKIVIEKKIESLFHFTTEKNLLSILDNGIVPVNMHVSMNIYSEHNDHQRMDNKLDYSSISISFPNYKLFWNFREIYKNTNWGVLLISPDLLFSESNYFLFYDKNAASGPNNLKSEKELNTFNSFKNMFGPYKENKDKIVEREELDIPDNYTTNPQAEILVKGIISPSFIREVHFYEDVNNNETIHLYKKKHPEIIFSLNNYYFKPRKDWHFWK